MKYEFDILNKITSTKFVVILSKINQILRILDSYEDSIRVPLTRRLLNKASLSLKFGISE